MTTMEKRAVAAISDDDHHKHEERRRCRWCGCAAAIHVMVGKGEVESRCRDCGEFIPERRAASERC